MHLYKKFSARRYLALTASVKLRKSSPKQLEMNKFVRTKSPTGSKFSKIFFEHLYTGWIVVVHLYCGFYLRRQNRAPDLEPRFGQFRTSLRKDSVASMFSVML